MLIRKLELSIIVKNDADRKINFDRDIEGLM